jgi:hypothetical protein
LHIKSQKEQKIKNPAAEQRSSSQGCTVRAKAGPDRALVRGVFSVPPAPLLLACVSQSVSAVKKQVKEKGKEKWSYYVLV